MTVLTDAYAMNLTLAIPSLNRCGDENPPPLDLPSFDEILRFGILTRAAAAPSELYRRFLWQGSLLDAAKQKFGIAAEQATVSPVRSGNRWGCTKSASSTELYPRFRPMKPNACAAA